jgi:hypothetical protein
LSKVKVYTPVDKLWVTVDNEYNTCTKWWIGYFGINNLLLALHFGALVVKTLT